MTRKTEAQWLEDRLAVIRKLKKPSRAQSVILELAGRQDLSASDRRRFAAAVTAEKASVKASQAQARVDAIFARSDTADRKRRDRCNFILGSLATDLARTDAAFRSLLLAGIDREITEPRDLASLAPLLDELRALPALPVVSRPRKPARQQDPVSVKEKVHARD